MAIMLKLLFVILCCVNLTNAKDNEQTVRPNVSIATSLRPSTSNGRNTNSYRTMPLSQTISATPSLQSSSSMATPSTPGSTESNDEKPRLGLIIGCTLAGLVFIVIFIIITVLFWRRKKRKRRSATSVPEVVVSAVSNAGQPAGDFVMNESLSGSASTRMSESTPNKFNVVSYYNDGAEEEAKQPAQASLMLRDNRSKTVSMRPGLKKKIITSNGGSINIDDITLNIGPGCLLKNAEITLIKDDHNFAFKSLVDLSLVDTIPRVVEFLPDGLKFSKPALLTIKFETVSPDCELFVLHGSYNRDYQRTVWEVVTNDIEERTAEGVVNMRINGFCFYSYIMAKRGELARILSHLNHSFTCCAYVFYRRKPPMATLDISVVLVSEFVDGGKTGKSKQLLDHLKEGYTQGEKGMSKRVHTDRSLEVSLDFPELECAPYSFKVDQAELDSIGFVIDHFKGTAITKPACGVVKISEIHRSAGNKTLWKLNVSEEEEIKIEEVQVECADDSDEEPTVVYRKTKLLRREIRGMSRAVGLDWDSLAALMDVPYSVREEIRQDHINYPDVSSKAEKIFRYFNDSPNFCRFALEKSIEELDLHPVKVEMLDVSNKNEDDEPVKALMSPYENVTLRDTPLSSREMHRLSRRICVDWDSLAGLMDIAKAERDNIRANIIFKDDIAKAEKILSMFNHKRDFSRDKLVECLKGIGKMDLIKPVTTGAWQNLIFRNL